jgi:hypothetical protein
MSSRRAAQAALLYDALQKLQDFGERNVKDRLLRMESWRLKLLPLVREPIGQFTSVNSQ